MAGLPPSSVESGLTVEGSCRWNENGTGSASYAEGKPHVERSRAIGEKEQRKNSRSLAGC